MNLYLECSHTSHQDHAVLKGRSASDLWGMAEKAAAKCTQTHCQPYFSVKLGNPVGGEHYESKAFWSHDYVSDVAGSGWWQVVVEVAINDI